MYPDPLYTNPEGLIEGVRYVFGKIKASYPHNLLTNPDPAFHVCPGQTLCCLSGSVESVFFGPPGPGSVINLYGSEYGSVSESRSFHEAKSKKKT